MQILDEIWAEVGSLGLYQWATLFMFQTFNMVQCLFQTVSTFFLIEPRRFICNKDLTRSLNGVLPTEYNCEKIESCPIENVTWIGHYYSIRSEWNLMCENELLANSMVSTTYFFGVFGMAILAPLGDRWGRKNYSLTLMLFFALTGTVCSMVKTTMEFRIMYLLSGLVLAPTIPLVFVWSMEVTNDRDSLKLNILNMWHYEYIVQAAIGWLAEDWRVHIRIIALSSIPFILISFFCMDESPRWLVRKRHFHQAAKLFNRISRINKGEENKKITEDHLRERSDNGGLIPENETNGRFHNFLNLFSTTHMALLTTTFALCYLTASLASNVVIMDAGNLFGNPYMNVGFIGIFRTALAIGILFFVKLKPDFNRKQLFLISHGIVISLYFMVLLSHLFIDNFFPMSTTIFSVAAAVFNCLFWISVYQLVFEMYPTLLKNSAAGFLTMFEGLGIISVSMIIYLKRYWHGLPALVVLGFQFLTMVLGIIVFPEVIEDVESANLVSVNEPKKDFGSLNEPKSVNGRKNS